MYVNREWESQQGNASRDGRQMHTSPGKLPGDGSVGRLTSRNCTRTPVPFDTRELTMLLHFPL